MKPALLIHWLLAASAAVCLSGCLTHRTVSRGGQTVESGYVIKRPLKEAIQNSQ